MLRLYIGRAGSGRTSAILREMAEAADRGEGGNILIVPEQYSHDCERPWGTGCASTARY